MQKKYFVLFVLFSILSFSTDAPAALNYGTFTMTRDQLSNGSWSEWYGPGGEGQAGSFLNAGASSGNQWSFTAMSTGNAQPIASGQPYSGTYAYSTPYNVMFAFIAPGAWGDAFSLSNVAGTNFSALNPSTGQLQFLFTTSGTVNGTPVVIEALFNSATAFDYDRYAASHTGIGFQEMTLKVVPIPGAAWLLGAGVVGLAAIRRRSKLG